MPHLDLTPDLILQGLAALFLGLWAWRDARKARTDATKAVAPNPVVAAVSMAWDRNQQERLMQIMERMAKAQEEQASFMASIAQAQGIMVDKRQSDFQEKIDELLERMKRTPLGALRRRKARAAIVRARAEAEKPEE